MRVIGRNLIPEEAPRNTLPPLSWGDKAKIRYYHFRMKRCNKLAEKYGTSSSQIYGLLWDAAVSKRASYYYREQVIYVRAEIREGRRRMM
ncbi:hypothetical protein J1P26_19945 [Neobacillus sp. MM2021_6]|uniref:hypothetical protein n=1 Tax=Bacillaceae TaxID=186817 RepID=UPI001409C999|nr:MULTISPECIES: hypothetical protein [Bacillaceae]MBO0961981.1 hypothetical protein [Neobacillus sp. MM2021_6]NHC20322.1 hypothetical protein [Bacillus sp. MM2020_4]